MAHSPIKQKNAAQRQHLSYFVRFFMPKGHQTPRSNETEIAGIRSGKTIKPYNSSPVMTIVAIWTRLRTPEGIIAPKVPARIIAAVMMTVPIFAMEICMASRTLMPFSDSSRKRSSKKME